MAGDPDELFRLVMRQADKIALLPERDREAALAGLHGQHERSGFDFGMSREAAIEMADRLDTWIREVLRLRPDARSKPATLH